MKLDRALANPYIRLPLMAVSFVAVFIALFLYFESRYKRPVDDAIPNMFPLLVLTAGESGDELRGHIVYHKNLAEFREEHEEYTFLVPQDMEPEIRAQIDSGSRYHRPDFDWQSPDPWSARFEVERIDSGRQRIRLAATWDDDRVNIGWYEATEQDFTPLYYKFYFGPGVVMLTFFWSVIVTILVWIAISLYLSRRRRKPSEYIRVPWPD